MLPFSSTSFTEYFPIAHWGGAGDSKPQELDFVRACATTVSDGAEVTATAHLRTHSPPRTCPQKTSRCQRHWRCRVRVSVAYIVDSPSSSHQYTVGIEVGVVGTGVGTIDVVGTAVGEGLGWQGYFSGKASQHSCVGRRGEER